MDFNDKLNIVKRKTKKTQIMIYDTGRKVSDYISRIKYRKTTNYNDIPHFIINKNGEIFQLFPTEYYSTMFNKDIDKRQIKISLENLGWLNKNSINNVHYNWVGDKTFDDPYLKRWRKYFLWDEYTPKQIESLLLLTSILFVEHDIERHCVVDNTVFSKIESFKGIVYKSNFSDIYTDINPSFLKYKINERL